MHPNLTAKVKADKLVHFGFIRKMQYPVWLANIVPVKKKSGRIRVYIDFQDLEKASLLISHMELLTDATTSDMALSFMDEHSGYNQIKMHPNDVK